MPIKKVEYLSLTSLMNILEDIRTPYWTWVDIEVDIPHDAQQLWNFSQWLWAMTATVSKMAYVRLLKLNHNQTVSSIDMYGNNTQI